jgi:methylated-DNA-[protein]-cysteine S-methyltransferase
MSETLHILSDRLETPIGELWFAADHGGNLRATAFTEGQQGLLAMLRAHYRNCELSLEPSENPHGITTSLAAYFRGNLAAIDTLPVKTAGTDFQRGVWHALREIPRGTTISYGQLANRIKRPKAVRAVGLANGANPIAVVVPCHRVIGSDGSLTGYGGGIERKRWLLEHESKSKYLPFGS